MLSLILAEWQLPLFFFLPQTFQSCKELFKKRVQLLVTAQFLFHKNPLWHRFISQVINYSTQIICICQSLRKCIRLFFGFSCCTIARFVLNVTYIFFLTVSYCRKYSSTLFGFLDIILMLHLYKQLIHGQGCYLIIKQVGKGSFLHTVQSFSLQNTETASKPLLWKDPQPLLIPESPAGIIKRT